MSIKDNEKIRKEFPSIQKKVNGRNRIFLDGAGGTQVPQIVINAMSDYLINNNANQTGVFKTSINTEELVINVRKKIADFINAPSWKEIIIGPNMTTITYNIVFAMSRYLNPGDEVVVTRLDHGANIDTWKSLQDFGCVIKYIEVDSRDCTLDYDLAKKIIGPKTKIVAVGLASNAVGTVNDIRTLTDLAHKFNAVVYVDAVHFAPHFPIDVTDLDCDFLACSAYKFYGPHVGFVWGKKDILDMLRPYKPWESFHETPDKFTTGTPCFEGFAGACAAIDFIAGIGRDYGQEYKNKYSAFTGQRLDLKLGMEAIAEYGLILGRYLYEKLKDIKGLKIYGITDPDKFRNRCPTFSFTLEGKTSIEIAEKMSEEDIYVWSAIDGFGALELVEFLNVVKKYKGLLRVSLEVYNTIDEINKFLNVLNNLII